MKISLDKVFQVSLVFKGLDGFFELFGGLILVFVSTDDINHIVKSLTQNELSENPHNFIANHLLDFSHHLSKSSLTFGAIYLILHGLIKVVLVIAVLREELWAYPWMIAFLVIFIIYQIYRLILGFTFSLTLLTVFDIFITILTVLEYKKHKKARLKTKPA
jgi:uncharacterized membrane protein